MEYDTWICLLSSSKFNVMVSAYYLKGAFNFTTKIPIHHELGVWMYLLSTSKSNVVIYI